MPAWPKGWMFSPEDEQQHDRLLKNAGVVADQEDESLVEVADFYAIPETEPVGWVLGISYNKVGDPEAHYSHPELSQEFVTWCIDNLESQHRIIPPAYRGQPYQLHFISERDYTLTKMFWDDDGSSMRMV